MTCWCILLLYNEQLEHEEKYKKKIHCTALVVIECFMYFYVHFLNVSCVQTKSQKFLKLLVFNV